MSLEQSVFGTTADGEEVTEYLLKNDVGMTARVITLGATLRTLTVPDARGNVTDVVLGFDDVAGYESTDNQYFGCTVGRVANRIAEGRFALEGRPYRLATNNGPNHLHGGDRGWDKAVWAAHGKLTEEGPAVMLTHTSPSYDEGYPGQVTASVTYTLTHAGELRLEYEARASDATPINMTHHSYFNLAGAGAETVLDHELLVLADRYTPVDDDLIPTGALADVRETPLDFRRSTRIGDRVEELVPTATIGYDHNYALADGPRRLSQACTLRDPASGRVMEIWTTEPGLQFYTGNFLFGQTGKGGATYALRSACCLETQHFPDSVNQPTFPSTIYAPGRTYTQTTVHRFYAE
ncbi:MAG: galactose mutarotase [bacterium]|nr:galactose mutarotase [bacterium]